MSFNPGWRMSFCVAEYSKRIFEKTVQLNTQKGFHVLFGTPLEDHISKGGILRKWKNKLFQTIYKKNKKMSKKLIVFISGPYMSYEFSFLLKLK